METIIYIIVGFFGIFIGIGLIFGTINVLFTELKEYTFSTILGGTPIAYLPSYFIDNYWICIASGGISMLIIALISKSIRSFITHMLPFLVIITPISGIIGWYFFQLPILGIGIGVILSIIVTFRYTKRCPKCGSFNTQTSWVRSTYHRGEYWPYSEHGINCEDCNFYRVDWTEDHEE